MRQALSLLCGLAVLGAVTVSAADDRPGAAHPAPSTQVGAAAEAAPAAGGAGCDVHTGPATVPPHWSKYKYPDSIPEGAQYHIIVKGDTLWDLARKCLGNPYLWPQIWDQNRYITDAHWIYPGDPIIFPKVQLVGEHAGAAGGEAGGEAGMPGELTQGEVKAGDVLFPITEEETLQCGPYVVSSREDESLQIFGSEQAHTKVAFAARDILYLNKGSNAGIKAGDVFSIHHAGYDVRHPLTDKRIGTKVETLGWLRVILVQDNAATAVVEASCLDIHAGDYLKPFERVNVPLAVRRDHADRLSPHSGKAQGYVVDIEGDRTMAGAGHLVTVDLGSGSGIGPGNTLTVYRIDYPSVPSPRNVVGELAVLAVHERTSLAKIMYSSDAILTGDEVELR